MSAPSHAAGIRARTKSGRRHQSGSGPPCGSRNWRTRKRQREKEPGGAKEAAPDGNHPQRNRAPLGKSREALEGIGRGFGKRLGEDAQGKTTEEALSARSPAHPAEKQGAKAKGRLQAPKEKDAAATTTRPRARGESSCGLPGQFFQISTSPFAFQKQGAISRAPCRLVPGRCRRHVLHAAARRFERLERAREVAVLHEDVVRVIGRDREDRDLLVGQDA